MEHMYNIISCPDLKSKALKICDPPRLIHAYFNPNVAKSTALAGTFWPELRAIRRAAVASTGAMPAIDTRMYTRHIATHTRARWDVADYDDNDSGR